MPAWRNPTVVRSAPLTAAKRRAALRTLWLPIAGTAVAAVSAFFVPVGAPELVLLAVMYVIVTLGTEVGFHRLVAHRAFKTFAPVRSALYAAGLMSAQGVGVYWAATHRRHHAHSDTPLDPHSPHARDGGDGAQALGGWRGLWHAHQGHTYTEPATQVAMFAPDLVRDPVLRAMDARYPLWVALGLLLPAVAGGLWAGTWAGAWNGFLWGGPVRIFVQHQLFFTNASIGHRWGEQPFDTGDRSRNNWLCAIWTFGSALQNTHHAYASAAYLSRRWYELDLAGLTIRAMAAVRLAWDVRLAPPEAMDSRRRVAVPPAA